LISAGGSALLGCAADPSDPRRRRRQAQQKDLPLPWPPHGGAARRPRRVPHRHGGATGPACLRVVLPLGSASGSARPSRASGQAPRLLPAPPHRCHERECVAVEDHRGDARPLRHRGRRATVPPIDVAAGPQRPGASPLPPSIAGSLLRVVKPASPSSSAPLPPPPCARGRAYRDGSEVASPPRSWSSGRLGCTSPARPPLLCSSVLSRWGEMRIKVGCEYPARCTRDCTQRFVPLLLLFLFPDQRSGLRRPVVRRRFIVDTPEGRRC